MFTIGITGGTGSGKTAALTVAKTLGALTLDCDAIYHTLLDSNDALKAEIKSHFPDVIIDDKVDRKKLGEIVFRDKSALRILNSITHKYVVNDVKCQITQWEKQGGKFAVVDAIALIESGADKICDITVGIIAPIDLRISRIMNRDNISREKAELRVNAQQSDDFYINNCDYILKNLHSSLADFEEECRAWFTLIRLKKR